MKRLLLIALLSPMAYASDNEANLPPYNVGDREARFEEALEDSELGLGGAPAGPATIDDEVRPVLPIAAGGGGFDNEDSDEAEEEDF